jgi:hypothetical protein
LINYRQGRHSEVSQISTGDAEYRNHQEDQVLYKLNLLPMQNWKTIVGGGGGVYQSLVNENHQY